MVKKSDFRTLIDHNVAESRRILYLKIEVTKFDVNKINTQMRGQQKSDSQTLKQQQQVKTAS